MAHWDYTLTITWPTGDQVTFLPEGYWTHAPDAATEDDVKLRLRALFLADDPDATISNFRVTRRECGDVCRALATRASEGDSRWD